MKDKILLYLGLYGKWVGLGLIVLVSIWDIFQYGFRGFFEYAICWKGIILIWAGVILIGYSKAIERYWGK